MVRNWIYYDGKKYIQSMQLLLLYYHNIPGARHTNDISIAFEIRWNFAVPVFITYSADHNEISHPSWQ